MFTKTAFAALVVIAGVARADVPPPTDEQLLSYLSHALPAVRVAAADTLRARGYVEGDIVVAGLVDVDGPDIVKDIALATADNPAGERVAGVAHCFARQPLADGLLKAAAWLREHGHRLVVRDCYRPLSFQKQFKAAPSSSKLFASAAKSYHPRGAAADVALASADGTLLPLLPDEFTPALFRADAVVAEPFAGRRALLRAAMKAAGLRGINAEFWHFEHRSGAAAKALDVPLEAVVAWKKATTNPTPPPPR